MEERKDNSFMLLSLVAIVAVVGMVMFSGNDNNAGTERFTASGQAHYSPIAGCSDSDGGQNIFEKGTVSVRMDDYIKKTSSVRSESDYCYDGTEVVEYSCAGNTPRVAKKSCPERFYCEDGACRNPYPNNIDN